MRFFKSVLTVAAALVGLAGIASAVKATTNTANPIRAPLSDAVLVAGQAFTITWSPNAGSTISLYLRKGEPGSLELLTVIAKDAPNTGVFIYTPSPQLAAGSDYAIQIISGGTNGDEATQNYSPRFKIDSNGPGLKSTTLFPSTTVQPTFSITQTATYTGSESKPTAAEDIEALEVTTGKSAAAAIGVDRDAARFGLIIAIGAVVGGLLI